MSKANTQKWFFDRKMDDDLDPDESAALTEITQNHIIEKNRIKDPTKDDGNNVYAEFDDPTELRAMIKANYLSQAYVDPSNEWNSHAVQTVYDSKSDGCWYFVVCRCFSHDATVGYC